MFSQQLTGAPVLRDDLGVSVKTVFDFRLVRVPSIPSLEELQNLSNEDIIKILDADYDACPDPNRKYLAVYTKKCQVINTLITPAPSVVFIEVEKIIGLLRTEDTAMLIYYRKDSKFPFRDKKRVFLMMENLSIDCSYDEYETLRIFTP
jgi:hypothetical protein